MAGASIWPARVGTERRGDFVTASRALLRHAILVLLHEREDHGYALVERLAAAGLGRVDGAGVYRALQGLEGEGAARSWWTSTGRGAPRRTYVLTEEGEAHLRRSLEVLAHQRDTLAGLVERGPGLVPCHTTGHHLPGEAERLLRLA